MYRQFGLHNYLFAVIGVLLTPFDLSFAMSESLYFNDHFFEVFSQDHLSMLIIRT